MPRIQWREQLIIDKGIIDQDHMHLIGIINRFADINENDPERRRLLDVLFSLRQYTQIHFEREEELQEKAGYPGSNRQSTEHVVLIEQLDGLIDALKEADGGDISAISGRTALFLNGWLVDHIIGSDIGMRPYVVKMKPHVTRIEPLQDVVVI